jgi:hypothetical protein
MVWLVARVKVVRIVTLEIRGGPCFAGDSNLFALSLIALVD